MCNLDQFIMRGPINSFLTVVQGLEINIVVVVKKKLDHDAISDIRGWTNQDLLELIVSHVYLRKIGCRRSPIWTYRHSFIMS